MTGAVSDTEVARWALDASDWIWGTVQGGFNEKQSTSQIVVDAVIGMIPVLGDVTAVRDLIAISMRLSDNPKKREEVMEWVLLVVLIFALIPVMGGVIKGVGRLLIKAAKELGEHSQAMRDIMEFLNRVGHGDQLKWFRELDFAKYQGQVTSQFNALIDKLLEVFTAFRDKLAWFTTAGMKSTIERRIAGLKSLKADGAKMIPQAIKELDAMLKQVQQAMYKGEWHALTPGAKTITRVPEAHLLEGAARAIPRLRKGFPKNSIGDYKHVDGWPDLRQFDPKTRTYSHEAIEAFSGVIRAIELPAGTKIVRILKPTTAIEKGNFKSSPWWAATMPKTPEEWRELSAVLDKFNKNGHFITYVVPAGTTLKAWAGKAAEQFDGAVGQYLHGGGDQMFVEFPAHIKTSIEALPHLPTNWGGTVKLFGYGGHANAAIAEIQLERLTANELRSKLAAAR